MIRVLDLTPGERILLFRRRQKMTEAEFCRLYSPRAPWAVATVGEYRKWIRGEKRAPEVVLGREMSGGEALWIARKRCGMTQRMAAMHLGVVLPRYQAVELGDERATAEIARWEALGVPGPIPY